MVTSGGAGVTSGRGWSPLALAWLLFAAVATLVAVVNAMSVIADRAGLGHPVPAWEPWIWELTSLVGWLAAAPLAFIAAARFAPARPGWPRLLAIHALLSVAVSFVHVGVMTGLRWGAYAALGEAWRRDGVLGDILLYEYRKDVVTYVMLVLLYAGARHVLAARMRPAPAVPSGAEARIEAKDGARTVWLAPADIDWAQAAGNYVELHGRFGTLLDRRTLAALEAELAPHGFARIHRSRIVRAATIRSIETKPSGDFELALDGGERLVGSRRYRERLAGGISSEADARG
jgi:hypothetical protein